MDYSFNPYLRDLSGEVAANGDGSRAGAVNSSTTALGGGNASDCWADGPQAAAIDVEALLPYSPTMPLVIRQRLRGMPPEVVEDETYAKALLDDAFQETGDYAAARVLLLRKHEIELSILRPLFAQGLAPTSAEPLFPQPRQLMTHHVGEFPEKRSPFGNIKFSKVGPLFHFFPYEDPILSQFRVPRSRLPLAMLKETCQRLEDAERQFGPLDAHATEDARTQYLEAVGTLALRHRKVSGYLLCTDPVRDRSRV